MRKQISIYVDEELHKALTDQAWKDERPLSNLCGALVRDGLNAYLRKFAEAEQSAD